MTGNNVRVIRKGGQSPVQGELRRLDAAGATIYRNVGIPEAHGNLFVPMGEIVEIVDLGRGYR